MCTEIAPGENGPQTPRTSVLQTQSDAARSEAPTGEDTALPNSLEIASFDVHGGRTVTVNCLESRAEHATSLELLHKLSGEKNFAKPFPVPRPPYIKLLLA